MKKLLVILFLVCTGLGEWRQSDEIALPKNLQINDLTFGSNGELYILSTTSILEVDSAAKNPLYIESISNGKTLSGLSGKLFIVNDNDQLSTLRLDASQGIETSDLSFNNVHQITSTYANNNEYLIVSEPGNLTFVCNNKIIGSAVIAAERLSIVPGSDYYNDRNAPIFTLSNNRIYSWTGGNFTNASVYSSKVIYSASHTIFDLTSDASGNVYILFADSIVVVEANGKYRAKIPIEPASIGARILNGPSTNSLAVYDSFKKIVRIFTSSGRDYGNEIITLNANQPNPVDNYTEIGFFINQPLDLTITIYNLIGEPVKVIARGRFSKGPHQVIWNADDEKGNMVPNGVYFYRLETKKGVAIKQLVVLR